MRLGDALGDSLRGPLATAVLAVSCLLLCAACADESSDPEPTDRAPAADLFSAWPGDESLQIAGAPSVVVGLDESLPLDGSIGAVFFGDGIAIANRISREVLILDAAGGLLSRHGRRGEGPGEYINLSGIARHADGLITWDSNRFRVTLLDALRGVHRRDQPQTAWPGKDRDRWSLRKQRAARNLADGISGGRVRRADGDPAACDL